MVDSSVRVEFEDVRAHRIPRALISREGRLSKFATCIAAFEIAEALAVILAALAAKLLYIDFVSVQMQSIWPYLAPAPLLALILCLFLKQAGLYDASALHQRVVPYGRVFGALASSFLIVLGILFVLKFADWYSRGWFLTWFTLSGILLISVRVAGTQLMTRMVASGRIRHRIALLGTNEFVTSMKAQIETDHTAGSVDGLYLAAPTSSQRLDVVFDGGVHELRAAIEDKLYDTVILGFPIHEAARIKAAINDLASYSTELLICTRLDRDPLIVRGGKDIGALRADIVNLVPLSETNRLLKTALDYVLAAIGLFLLSPLLIAIAVVIKLDSPGPIFFRQRRYGQNNRIFRIFKFRTMRVTEDGQHVKQAQRNDPRVTRVGWFLRRTSLDELPQLINVLTGDMSIVGPRPHALVHDHQFEQQLDRFSLRRRVRPGLTGWAQVHGFRGETKTTTDIRNRVEHDLYYIDNWSIWLDIEIMIRTIFVLFRGAF